MVELEIGPNLLAFGAFLLSWHGFFSFVAVATALFLVGRWAPMRGIEPDTIYSIAMWAIIGGIVGARIVHVVDQWGFYRDNPGQIIAIWSGGIGLWGGIIGGFIAGTAYAFFARHPIGVIADLAAPAILLGQTIGRLGDIVNGEHCAKAADFFLGFIWTNPVSNAQGCENGIGVSVHPVIAYEMTWNMVALLIIWNLRGRLKPDGMIWALYLALYASGRFLVSLARDDRIWALGLQEAHYIALVVLAITVPLLVVKGRLVPKDEALAEPVPAVAQRGTRAERRRRGQRQ